MAGYTSIIYIQTEKGSTFSDIRFRISNSREYRSHNTGYPGIQIPANHGFTTNSAGNAYLYHCRVRRPSLFAEFYSTD
jgi:hypothetical protein